jgi:hypothetical protein
MRNHNRFDLTKVWPKADYALILAFGAGVAVALGL